MVSEKMRLDDSQELRFGFSIEEGMGVNTSISVLLDGPTNTIVNIDGPSNLTLQKTFTSDYIHVPIPGVAEV